MNKIKILILFISGLLLISCGADESKRIVKKRIIKSKPITINTAVLEKQEAELKSLFEKKYIPLEYEHIKDPFKSVIDVYRDNLQSNTGSNPLQSAALDQIKLVGVMEAEFGNIGVVEVVGKTFYIKVGDKMGMNSGIVVEISEEIIKLRQMETDIFGNTRSELVELMMEKKEGSL